MEAAKHPLPTELLRLVVRALPLADQFATHQAVGGTPRAALLAAARTPFYSLKFDSVCTALSDVRTRRVVKELQALELRCARSLSTACGNGALLEIVLAAAASSTFVPSVTYSFVEKTVVVPVDACGVATPADFDRVWLAGRDRRNAVEAFKDLKHARHSRTIAVADWPIGAFPAAGVPDPFIELVEAAGALTASLHAVSLTVTRGVVRAVVFNVRVRWEARIPGY
jgi:hypothetical protein